MIVQYEYYIMLKYYMFASNKKQVLRQCLPFSFSFAPLWPWDVSHSLHGLIPSVHTQAHPVNL